MNLIELGFNRFEIMIQFPVRMAFAIAALFRLIPQVNGNTALNHHFRTLSLNGNPQADRGFSIFEKF
ncbi:hypothetical protein FACS189438_3220 [Bacteroidia bacterium]|nr:hypothetical protein FACS189438_3220 [Bacteroidia bacterium]